MDKEDNATEFDPFAEPEKKQSRSGGAIAWLALLIALGLVAWNAWTWWEGRVLAGEEARLAEQLNMLESSLLDSRQSGVELLRRLDVVEGMELDQSLARLDRAIEQAESISGSDRRRVEAVEQQQQAAAQRLEGLESGMAAIVVRSESPRQALELAEVDYLLRSANERLLLYGDQRTADQALALADAQLEALDDPVYLPVRQAIAASRLALAEVPVPDLIGVTETMDALQTRISGLPFSGSAVVTAQTAQSPFSPDADNDDARPGLWERFKAALTGLVTVRRRSDEDTLVSLEDEAYVRQGLWLQLESARLALLRQNDAAFHGALNRAELTLSQYFDGTSPRVVSMTKDLQNLASVALTSEWPDVSGPWVALQRIRTVQKAADDVVQPEAMVAEPAPESDAVSTAGDADE